MKNRSVLGAIMNNSEYKLAKSPLTAKQFEEILNTTAENRLSEMDDINRYFYFGISTGFFRRETITNKYFILMEDNEYHECESPFIDEDWKQRRKTIKLL